MRTIALLGLCATIAGCATAPPTRGAVLEIAEDGRTAVYRKQLWSAGQDLAFFQRGSDLHLVSQLADRPMNLKAEALPDGTLRWPADPRIEVAHNVVRWRTATSAALERVKQGQLHPHESHLHLTHHYDNPDLQALYRARQENSPYPPIRRQIAAALIALLVEEKLPAESDEIVTASLRRLDRVLAKVRRGFEAGLAATALTDMLSHDFEIREESRLVEVEGRVFRAGEGLRFAYCSNHFHVQDTADRWAHPVEFGEPGAFSFPPSPLFAVSPQDEVYALPGPKLWREMLERGEIQMLRDHWHLTARFGDPSFVALRAVADDPQRPEEIRLRARDAAFEILRARLELKDEASFEASVARVRKAAAAALKDLEKTPAPAARPAKPAKRP